MNFKWKLIEEFNRRKLIPVALILLLGIIIIELFFHIENPALEKAVKISDTIVIIIFVIDLVFLAIHSKNARFFFRNYWLDLLAVFPFALVFNVVEQVYRGVAAAERIALGQTIVHEGLEAERFITKEGRVAKLIEGEKLLAKEGRIVKFLRIIPRGLRVMFKTRFFTTFEEKRNRIPSGKTKKRWKKRAARNKIS